MASSLEEIPDMTSDTDVREAADAPSVIGVVAESNPAENRVAATPATVAKLIGLGYRVVVESGAPAEVLGNPQHRRTRDFLSKIL